MDLTPEDLEGIPIPRPTLSTQERADLRRYIAEAKERELEALQIYEPLPFQEAYHRCPAKEAILCKGNQSGGDQPITEPVLTPSGWRMIGELKVGDKVIGGDGNPCTVMSVHPQGMKPVYQLTFDDGATTRCTNDHHWLCKLTKSQRFKSSKYYKDEWKVYTLRDIRQHGGDDPLPRDRAVVPVCCVQFGYRHVPVAPYTLGVLLGDGSISQDSVSFTTEDDGIAERVMAELPEGMVTTKTHRQDNGKAYQCRLSRVGTGPNPIMDALRQLGLMGCRSEHKFIPRSYLENSVDVRVALLQGLMDTDGYCAKERGVPYFYSCSERLARDVMELVRSLGGKATMRWKETHIVVKEKVRGTPVRKKQPTGTQLLFTELAEKEKKQCLHMAEVQMSLPAALPIFGLDRKQARRAKFQGQLTTGRVLHTIRPAGNEECVCICVDSPDNTYVTNEYVVTHNSLAGFIEVARAVTNTDPHRKYPQTGTAVCLGYGEGHIGRVIHKYLFRWGAFQIIRDLDTREWRVFRPWSPEQEIHGKRGDRGREPEARPAPPMIPKRYIDGKIAWLKRSQNIFSYVKFKTGWELYAFNSQGEASMAQGFQVDLYDIDEDLATQGWYEEALGRTSIRAGKIRWHALPHSKTDDIVNMIQRAEQLEDSPNPSTVCVRATMYDNPYYPEESKRHNEVAWREMGEDVYRKRALGELTLDSLRMYPMFGKDTHDAIRRLSGLELTHESVGRQMRAKVQKVLTEGNGVPPHEWCRYMVFDPGYSIGAVLFCAVPPPREYGDFKIIYDELYLQHCTAKVFGQAVEPKIKPYQFQDFIIDSHGGNLRELGSGVLPRRQYEQELENRKLECEARGAKFLSGSDDVEGRELMVRRWLETRSTSNPLDNGYPMLLVVVERCPNLCREILNFRKQTVRVGGRDIVTDKGNRRMATHLVECMEYAAAHGLAYVAPPRKVVAIKSIADEIRDGRRLRELQRRMKYGTFQSGNINLGPNGGSYE